MTTSSTTAAMTMRCQKGIAAGFAAGAAFPQSFSRSVERQRAAAGEAVVLAVPPGDLVLAELPAEKHRPALVQRREVDQPTVDVLHLGAVLRDLVDDARKLLRDAVDLRGRLSELGRRDPAAVAADLALELLLALECRHVLEPGRHELLHQGPHLLELGVRLVRREVPHDPNPMLRSWTPKPPSHVHTRSTSASPSGSPTSGSSPLSTTGSASPAATR